MCCFIVELSLDIRFEMDLLAIAAVWRSGIDLVMVED
jgi:hypothetical protein